MAERIIEITYEPFGAGFDVKVIPLSLIHI